jgi:CSLREA domain-containing protein
MLPHSFPGRPNSQRAQSSHRKNKRGWAKPCLELLEDRIVLARLTVNSATDGNIRDGVLTLREAISLANGDLAFTALTDPEKAQVTDGEPAKSQTDTIAFGIDSGLQTIKPLSFLPIITDSLIIDGTTQPGWSVGHPVIEISGSLTPTGANGLDFVVGVNKVLGLIINNFKGDQGGNNGFGIILDGTKGLNTGSVIQGNFIGTDSSGAIPAGNEAGIGLLASTDNTIGGLDSDGALKNGNLLSGNIQSGIFIDGKLSTVNHIEGNFIGTDVTGTKALGNGDDGIFLGPPQSSPELGFPSGNFITSFDLFTGVFEPNGRNIIGGNKHNGVYILGSGSGNTVQGNYIGLGVDGKTPVPNEWDGVRIEDARFNVIGGAQDGAGNVISSNLQNGVEIVADEVSENSVSIPVSQQSALSNVIRGNFIGTDSGGLFSSFIDLLSTPPVTRFLGNGQNGILLQNLSPDPSIVVDFNTMGGADIDDGAVDDKVGARNLISGNLDNGISMLGPRIVGNVIEGDFIGIDKFGSSALPNAHSGILLSGFIGQIGVSPSANRIGGTRGGAGNVISGNGIDKLGDGSAKDGIRIAHGSLGNFVENNFIGADASGLKPLPNFQNGIVIEDSPNNVIGGPDSNDGNVIGGNNKDGVVIFGADSTSNKIQQNLIGLGADESTPLGNLNGIFITADATGGATDNLIGGTQIVAGNEVNLGNVISLNIADGIKIDLGAGGNQVIGNFIGTDKSGVLSLGNGAGGLEDGSGVAIIDASTNVIGGFTAAQRNVIVDNAENGVLIEGSDAALNVVIGNYIGIGSDGESPLANSGDGVLVDNSPGNFIGRTGVGTGNTISGNTGAGVHIQGAHATLNQIEGNSIGADAKETQPVGNQDGVRITDGASSNVISDDVISGNFREGVLIQGGNFNVLHGNSIGTNQAGLTPPPLPNGGNGVSIADAQGTLIGGASFTDGGNLISGNSRSGIFVTGALTTGTQIQGNHIGFITDEGEDKPLGNKFAGITVSRDTAAVGPSQTFVTSNTIGGNLLGGITLSGVTDTHITSNFIGVGRNGADPVPIPNNNFGVSIRGSSKNFVGEASHGNVIAFTVNADATDPTSGAGILLSDNSTGNKIADNTISDNAGDGVLIQGTNGNAIGGPGADGNVIIRNDNGVEIRGAGAKQNVVRGNFIGIDIQGAAAGNKSVGVILGFDASFNTVGGFVPGDGTRNVISANNIDGILITAEANNNAVAGNFIGTDLQGSFHTGFGNKAYGVEIQGASHNVIGGEVDTPGIAPGNEIINNGGGVGIFFIEATENSLEGNEIASSMGFGLSGASNQGAGVLVDRGSFNNHIGGPNRADANSIHDNKAAGVDIASGTDNAIHHNRIFNNGGLGIDLADDGSTANDRRENKDSDIGANQLQNKPTLDFATTGESHALVGTLESAPSTTFTLEIYLGDSFQHSDGTEEDNALRLINTSNPVIRTNASGVAIFSLTLPGDIAEGSIFRATVTDAAGNTSEFSNAVEVLKDNDGDGVPDDTENHGPNGGDANFDGKQDSQQDNVATLPDELNSNGFITLVAPNGLSFQNVRSLENPSPDDAPVQTEFGLGFLDFTVAGLSHGQSVAIQEILPVTVVSPQHYFRYGKTANTPVDHWFDWPFDTSTNTGAEITGNTITLHFVDGGRGDDDLSADGIIVDPGAAGFPDDFTVTNSADAGRGSLRQAILNANANPGKDFISFDIQIPGSRSINLLSPLPAITDPVTIDGTTQPGFAGTPLIELDGSQAGTGTDGLAVSSGFSTIQGLVINRFSGAGIHMQSDGFAQVEGNFIGTDLTGTVALGNGSFGVVIDNSSGSSVDNTANFIGSSQPNGRNVISGNAAGGIFIHSSDPSGRFVKNNLIGTQADGVSPLGNGGPGVLLDGDTTFNSIGASSPDQGNTIAFNVGAGVEILKATKNSVLTNSIFANGGLGIDLGGDGVSPNDADDSDTGSNDLQNFPVLTRVVSYGGHTYLTGTLTSTPNSSFALEFYASAAADPTGFGEGQSELGFTFVNTDSSGQAAFDISFEKSVAAGSFITALAKGESQNTSEFSAALRVLDSQVLTFTVNTTDDVNDAVPDPTHFSLREAILAANSHPDADIIRFDLPNLDRTISPLSALPDITDPVTIDGTSQPGFAGLPLVEIEGSKAVGAGGLRITGGGSVVRGLVIDRFQRDPNLGTGGSGIELGGLGGNRIEGNFLGTDVTGTNAQPNENADVLVNDSPDNLIGGTTAAARNVIVAVLVKGSGARGNHLEGNYISTDLTGTAFVANSLSISGIRLESGFFTTIGGLEAGAGNVIAGGIAIFASSSVVEGNLIGTDVTGTVFLSSGDTGRVTGGVEITGSAFNNLIGGATAAARNIIPGGVNIGGLASFNRVEGNYIGTDITGTIALGGLKSFPAGGSGAGNGVFIAGTNNTIGGTVPGTGNLISGNTAFGVGSGVFLDRSAQKNVLQGNQIGTDVTGTKRLGNFVGVTSFGFNNMIGGSVPGAGNIISGNDTYGLRLVGDGGNTIQGNFIGTDRTGTLVLGNGKFGSQHDGLYVSESNDTIGGFEPGAGNVISGNEGNGITITTLEGFPSGIVVQGNFIGTDVTGRSRLGNRGDGMSLQRSQNDLIGGTLPGAGNLISANGGSGVHILDFSAEIPSTGIVIQGNKIGTNVTGLGDLGNDGDGVSIVTSRYVVTNDIVGGADPGAGNEIAFNGGYGVSALFGTGNSIRHNAIFANAGLGIVTDINGELSTRAEERSLNLLTSIPVVTSALFDAQGTVLEGTFTGTPFTRYALDFFANDVSDPSGFGEGQTFLESISVFTDETGFAQFRVRLDLAVPIGQWITATATDTAGNTSLFARAIPVDVAVGADTVQFSAPAYIVAENGAAAVVVVTRTGSTSGTVTVNFATADGSATAGTDYTAQSGTLTFNDGEVSKTLSIPIQEDGSAEGDENFRILLTNPTGLSLGSVHEALVTIADNDVAGQIDFSTSAFSILESFQAPALQVTRTGGSHGRISVDYRVTGGTATPLVTGDSQNQIVDYQDLFGVLTFEDGQTSARINVTTFDDFLTAFNPGGPVFEGPETFEVTLGNPSGGATLGPVITTVLTITDDDDLAGGFAINQNGSAVEGNGSVQFQVIRSGKTNTTESVTFATVDGTARAGVNYQAASGTLIFKPGEEQKFISVPILDDGQVADPGAFQVVLSNPTGGAILDPGKGSVPVSILDTDSPGRFVIASLQFQENAGTALIEIDRLDGSRGAVKVNYVTSDGTAKAGSDYTATTGTLTFNAGETSKTISVPILSDNLVEGDETYFVTLSNPTGGATISDPNPAVETIFETAGQIQFSAADYRVAENSAGFTVVITLDRVSDPKFLADPNGRAEGTVTVNYATRDGTAQAGADYAAQSGTLTFLPGESRKTITIPTLSDSLVEKDETIVLTLSGATGGVSIGAGNSETITILDDDSDRQQLLVNPGGPYAIQEGEDLSLALSVTGGTASGVTWDINGDGIFGDAVGTNPTLTWSQLQSLGIVDGPGSFDVRVRGTDDLGRVFTSDAASLTVENVAPTAIFNNGSPVSESSTDTVTFTGVFDPSATDLGAGFNFSYDFDNDGIFEIVNSTSASATVPASFLDHGPGNYTVHGRVADKDGGFTDYTTTIVVNRSSESIQAIGLSVDAVAGVALSATIATFTNSLPGSQAADYTAIITWGDNSTSPGSVQADPKVAGQFVVVGTHTYSQAGNYAASINIAKQNGVSASATATIEVAPTGTEQPGQISGVVFLDLNADGIRETNEPELAGMTVYLDTDNNGRRETGETAVTTGGDGAYRFLNLQPATYFVRQDFEPDHGIVPTSSTTLHLGVTSGADLLGQDFGEVLISQVSPVEVIDNRFGNARSVQDALVEGYYNNLLQRTPEPAALTFWGNILTASASSLTARQLVFQRIWESPEHRGAEVAHYYGTYFHRQADAAGAAYFVHQFLAGATEQQVVLGFVLSAEYQQLNSGSTAFVGALFQDLLSRNGNSVELPYWSNVSTTAGAQAAALGIMNSDESLLRIIDGYYAALLHRAGETGGRDFWLSQFTGGNMSIESVVSGFLAGTLKTDEYFRSAQASVD